MKKQFLLSLLCLTLLFVSCEESDPNNNSETTEHSDPCEAITYTEDVKPLIEQRCLTCHATGQNYAPLLFTTYESLKATIDSGKFAYRVFELMDMPQGGALDEGELELLQCWIDNGALNN